MATATIRTCHRGAQGTGRWRRSTLRLALAGAVTVMALPLFAGAASADDFSNPNEIVIPGSPAPTGCPTFPPPNNSCPPTTAEPYSSSIAVAGLTGTTTDINVILRGLTHDSPADLDVMLAAPDGKTVMLMSDACAPDTDQNSITSAIDLTFDDAAAAALPADSACGAGTFKPVDDEDDPNFPFTGTDAFPAPAPASASSVLLSTFNGIDPNGTWNLWVVDDNPDTPGVASGRFAGGWTLSVTTPTTAVTTTTTTTVATTTTTTVTTTTASTTTTIFVSGGGGGTTTAGRSTGTGDALPRTGSSAVPLVAAGGALLAAGITMVRLTRIRRRARFIEVSWR